jgi:uncharacterized protein (DUF3084 family)
VLSKTDSQHCILRAESEREELRRQLETAESELWDVEWEAEAQRLEAEKSGSKAASLEQRVEQLVRFFPGCL